MKIDEAINNLKLMQEDPGMILIEGHTETIGLAIEALRRVKRQRKDLYPHEIKLLPGEE